MTATATTNGKPQRKQLSDELDRLDGIIDCLAEALPAAVADACREGARQAVKDAVVEILASPELRTLITGLAAARVAPPAPATPPTAPTAAKPPLWTRAKAKCKAATDAVVGRCKAATTAVVATAVTVSAVMPVKKILLVGTGVGLAVGVLSYACPHVLSAVVSGVGGMCTAVGVQVGHWVRRSAGLFGFGGTS
jgi:hypothetical protein